MKKRMKILLSCGLVITALAAVGPMVGMAGNMESQEEIFTTEETTEEVSVEVPMKESEELKEPVEEEQAEEKIESETEQKQETEEMIPEEISEVETDTEIQEQQTEESITAKDGFQEEETEMQIEETTQAEEEKKMEKKLERLEKLRKREAELERKESLTEEEEDELCDLPVKIQGIELECGLYDYKADIYIMQNTTEVSIKDMQRDLDTMDLPEEIVADIHNRINHLTPVYEKYKVIMEQAEQDPNADYEAIAKDLYADMHAVWDIINQ